MVGSLICWHHKPKNGGLQLVAALDVLQSDTNCHKQKHTWSWSWSYNDSSWLTCVLLNSVCSEDIHSLVLTGAWRNSVAAHCMLSLHARVGVGPAGCLCRVTTNLCQERCLAATAY